MKSIQFTFMHVFVKLHLFDLLNLLQCDLIDRSLFFFTQNLFNQLLSTALLVHLPRVVLLLHFITTTDVYHRAHTLQINTQ